MEPSYIYIVRHAITACCHQFLKRYEKNKSGLHEIFTGSSRLCYLIMYNIYCSFKFRMNLQSILDLDL